MVLKSPEKLAASASVTRIGSGQAGDYTSRTSGLGSVMGSTWSQRIIFDAQPDRVLSKYFIEFPDLMSTNDVSLIIPKIGDVDLMSGRTGDEEGIARSFTEFDTASRVAVSLTSSDVKLGGVKISFETAQATRVSIVEMAHKQLVRQYLKTLETDAFKILALETTPAAYVYGGDATGVASLATGDVITVDKLIDMKIGMQEDDFGKKPGDAIVFVHPTQYKFLLKSSQFTNAAEFGGPSVVRRGVIEEYVGCIIEVSTLVRTSAQHATDTSGGSGTNHNTSWGATGHICFMIDPSAAAGIVWKEKATVKIVTEDDERMYKVLLDAWYKMTRINGLAIVHGFFSDA